MVPPSSNSSADSGRSFFENPRTAPSLPIAANPVPISSRSTPEGYLLPILPPADDPLVITQDARGHCQLPRVSDTPLPVDDARVLKLVEHHPMIIPKCSNCAEMGVACSFSKAGIPCPPCSVLGIPDCDWADPFWFMENLQRRRDLFLFDECDALVKAVNDNRLSPALFEREFKRAQAWFYSGAQGAISRFMLNTWATRDIAVCGYQALAASSSDPSHLLRFLALGVETHIHPLILQVVAERLQVFFQSVSS
ncbi:hypothetical protein B0H17DRAFT_1215119 [Mycena rosella]|uniref:Uncharacterized protein n=1 Tax=Mycena rosella TaxID=1033263 RepID=A0AAD7G382_MYCRO|nr:hypothetical protein B0H17DRAFT_1215119 [Mycena rosella]